jgi:formamidopyrimidine-DNA glycosylase
MPELPEVETIKSDLIKKIIHQRISSVEVLDQRVIQPLTADKFIKNLKGLSVRNISRRGKALVLTLSNHRYLVVHLRMTGQLMIAKNKSVESIRTAATKVIFTLSNGKDLLYNDQRIFGRLNIVDRLDELSYFRKLGVEPLDDSFDDQWLDLQLKKRKMPIKPFLLDQHVIAGIGNIYASEILFQSKIKPTRPANRLKKEEVKLLYRSIIQVLREAIASRGTSMRNYRDGDGNKGNFMNKITVYGRANEICRHCRAQSIKKIVQAGRSTFYCSHCQH